MDPADPDILEDAQARASKALHDMQVANKLSRYWNEQYKTIDGDGRDKCLAQFHRAMDDWDAAYTAYSEANREILALRQNKQPPT